MADLNLYLLQRRGGDGPSDRAMIVGAVSEAHARVAAHDRSHDLVWADDAQSECREITPHEGVMHTIYATTVELPNERQ